MRPALLPSLLAFGPALALFFGLGPGLGPGVARADDVDRLGGTILEVQARVQELDRQLARETGPSPEAADRRLIDAQVLYELKNYDAASIILLDVVERYPKSQAYPEALFFLADSLFQKRDFFSSRNYFEKIVEVGPSAPRYQQALQRLIELSLYTGDYGPVDGYLARLEGLPQTKQLPSVPYVKGKYYYFRQKYDPALAVFMTIPAGHTYWFHSQYFIGAAEVAEGKLPEAINTFTNVLRTEPKTDSQRRIQELAHLALGRIYFDRNQLTNALTEYTKVPLKSDLQADALYEQAWVLIKSKDFKRAYRALDTLMTLKPDDPIIPEVMLLIGNLEIRQEEYTKATDQFTKTRQAFEPIKAQIDQLHPADAKAYFSGLIGKNLGKFDVATYLPPMAVKWVTQEPDVTRVVNLVGDVGDLQKSVDESEEIVKRLERALDAPSRINVFPELAHARAETIGLTNKLNDVNKQLILRQRELLAPVVGGERAQLDELASRRSYIEARLANQPQTADSLEAREKKIRAQFEELDKHATELNVIIATYAAERVAIDIYYHNTLKDQKVDRATFERELSEVKAVEESLRREYEQLRRDIGDGAQGVGVDDPETQEADRLRKQLAELTGQEDDLSAALRARLSGPQRAQAEQIASILVRSRAAQASIDGFNQKIDGVVNDRLKDIRVSLATEKERMAQYKKTLGGYEGETEDVGGGVTADSFRAVADRFYNIVVRADVGIIDVAWALKDTKTQENQRLVREEKRELKLLDDEFNKVLKE